MTKVSTEKVVWPSWPSPQGGIPHGVVSVPMLNDKDRNRQGPKSREGQGIRICAGSWFVFAPPAPLGAWMEASLALLFNLERRRRCWRGHHLIPAPRDARRVVPGCRFPPLRRACGRRFFLGRVGPLAGAHSFLELFCGHGPGEIIPLIQIAAAGFQEVKLLFRFHTFGDHF